MEQIPKTNHNTVQCRPVTPWAGSVEKIPMHPDDFHALHAWITAKRFSETTVEKNPGENLVSSWMSG